MLFRSFSYQDYGWQTHSGWLTETKVHSLVGVASTPWTWFAGDGDGYPTKAQIHETRIFRNNASGVGNPSASVTWSSFLLWSSLFYGLLPRFTLCMLGYLHLRRAFDRENFDKFDALWRRLTTPDVRIEIPIDVPLDPAGPRTNLPMSKKSVQGPELLLTPVEFNTPDHARGFQAALRGHDLSFNEIRTLPSLPAERQKLIDSLSVQTSVRPSRLLILQESCISPNESFVRFLSMLRSALGRGLPIHVILLHDSRHPRAENHLTAWHNRLDPLGDPLLSWVAIIIEPDKPTS
jgi:hypothetical protein